MAIEPEHRRKIRTNLYKHMRAGRISARQIETFIKERAAVFGVTVSEETVKRFLDVDAGKVGDERVLALENYLEVIKSEATSKSQLSGRIQDSSLFFSAQDFFNMTPRKASQHRDAVVGKYAFYAYSERGKDRVCRGAIEFSADPKGPFTVKELQRSIPHGSDTVYNEVLNGYFLFRQNSLTAFLRDADDKHPKFYILSIEPYKDADKKIVVMMGALLKIGARTDVFTGYVYMVRSPTAFKECAMLERSKVPSEIIQYLDSGIWHAT